MLGSFNFLENIREESEEDLVDDAEMQRDGNSRDCNIISSSSHSSSSSSSQASSPNTPVRRPDDALKMRPPSPETSGITSMESSTEGDEDHSSSITASTTTRHDDDLVEFYYHDVHNHSMVSSKSGNSASEEEGVDNEPVFFRFESVEPSISRDRWCRDAERSLAQADMQRKRLGSRGSSERLDRKGDVRDGRIVHRPGTAQPPTARFSPSIQRPEQSKSCMGVNLFKTSGLFGKRRRNYKKQGSFASAIGRDF